MTTTTVPAQIADFARRVRAALSDLPAEEVEELTDGLEADLAEGFAEDLRRELPDPAAYADELRTAAGFPRPEPVARRRMSPGETWTDLVSRLSGNPAGSAVLDFLETVRPVWWVARGLVVTGWLIILSGRNGAPVPRDVGEWTLAVLLVVASVQWSRARSRGTWWRRALVGANLVTALAVVPLVGEIAYQSVSWDEVDASGYAGPGLVLDGEPVTNVFAYDAQGNPIRDVQLYDALGRPLVVEAPQYADCLDEACTESGALTSRALENGQSAWNVFPLRLIEWRPDEYGSESPVVGAPTREVDPPLLKVPAVAPLAPASVEPMNPPEVAQNNR
ncbi:hypothetical protein [Aeromicrobium sp. IC_218]|uniref:hypothetical protein n=1 Tax=Aeromicrobium sp. IC_218 TaxID=2545468 RepID=UPI001038E371|nr:hypothetical protein [Aeromicrobium sp. IC_218]TCI98655.1 hypothetical protein E0W78_09795 [Aeromicrobium sp. IC_218]